MESTVPNSPQSFGNKTNESAMGSDLVVDEGRRRTAVLHAIGAHWDPAVVLAIEQTGCEMLYSRLERPNSADLRLPCDRACHRVPAEL